MFSHLVLSGLDPLSSYLIPEPSPRIWSWLKLETMVQLGFRWEPGMCPMICSMSAHLYPPSMAWDKLSRCPSLCFSIEIVAQTCWKLELPCRSMWLYYTIPVMVIRTLVIEFPDVNCMCPIPHICLLAWSTPCACFQWFTATSNYETET